MKRNVLMFLGLFVFALAATGCRAGGQSVGNQGILGGGFQQPTTQQTQQTFRNIGTRVSNSVINQGVNRLVNGVFSAL